MILHDLRKALVVAGLALLLASTLAAQPAAPRSPRNASYTIEATLDPVSNLITAQQTVTWRNLQTTPTDELWFHLYWNAWRNNQSTWLREDRSYGRSRLDDVRDEDWSYCDVHAARLVAADGEEDLTADLRFAAPDDGNADDRTVLVLKLPQPVAPGESVQVVLDWEARVPRTFARTGTRGDFFFIAHWFPQLGVYEPEGWNCHQFHALTEFYGDFGAYDVTLRLPSRFVVGATGRRVEREAEADGLVRHRFLQDDVHGFAWSASPDFVERLGRFEEPGLPAVDLRLLMQPEHLGQTARHLAATRATLELFGRWFGPYPYDHLTMIDPAWKSAAGGMEYPTLFTGGSRLFNPLDRGFLEELVIHEVGHQFWYGIVANNEIEHAWLDEGITTYATARAQRVAFGDPFETVYYLNTPGTAFRPFLPWVFRDVRWSLATQDQRRSRYLRSGAETADPMATPTYRYLPASAGAISYSKTSLWLGTLERYLGWKTQQKILSTFFSRWAFRHPRPEDFFAVAAEVSGQDLSWFFDQMHGRAVRFDYAIDSLASWPLTVEGLVEKEGELVPAAPPADGEATRYESEVVVRRHGDGVFPVDVLMVFADGTEMRRSWDGRARWTRFVEVGESKLAYAVVDPERVLLLDSNTTNNSLLRRPKATFAARKWASKWMVWLQDLLLTYAFFS